MENSKNILKDSCLFRMVMKMVVFVTLFAHSFSAYSQVGTIYPVEINAMLTPPYGTCLTDYVGSNRFQCNVLMRDMHATGYKFYIFMTVKDMASGRVVFSAQSDKHTITPGMPTYMAETGVFAEFFKPENILVSTAYKDGCLKEGSYNFVFQVVDARDTRRIPISKECVFPARLVAGGAPLLISPFTGTNIECGQTFVNFTWQMPIVTGEQTKYLIEICPTDEGGNGLHYLGSHTPSANGVGPSQGYIRATSYMPMYQLLESAEKKFEPNTTYFWRVSIIDEFGNVKPNSTSEIDSFTYCYTKELEPYTPLKEPKVKAINGELDTVHIDTVKTEDNATNAYWILDDVRFKYQSYALDVRKKSQDTWTTYYIEIKEGDPEERNYYGLSNLKYNELYEARMQYLLITEGDTSYAPYSDTIEFKVPNPMDTADCGEIMAIKDCNGEKGRILKKYDTLYANGTPVVLDSIIYKAGDSTVISGFGVVSFPILRNFKLKMKFNEVSVNCYGELISGQVVSVYNESTGAIIDLNHLTGNGDGGGSQSTTERPDPTNYKDKDEAKEKMQTGDYAQIGDSIYTKDKDGNLVALGKPLTIPADNYTNNNTLDDDDVYCIFRNDTKDAPYIGFDADEHKYYRGRPTLGDHYTPTFSKQDGADFEYIIPYVASNPGRVVKLSATLEGRLTDEYDKESLKFIMPMSGGDYLELNAKKEGDKFIVDFPGGKNPDTNSDVYAIVKKGEKYVNVGKINIETYAWRTQKVKIVPVVNDYGVDENAISETLNRIYGRFGITYEVTKDDRFESENINSEFLNNFSVSSGTFTKQSDDMKRLQYDYKAERGLEDSTAYIFLLKSAVDYPAIDGDMPQGQICGYIFMHSDNGTLSDGRLVAHELAHGIYRLDHVFEKAYGIPENSTDNLLDYNNGDQLAHFQWELIKKPGFAWAIFESDEDNMALSKGVYAVIKVSKKELNEKYKEKTDGHTFPVGTELMVTSSKNNNLKFKFVSLDDNTDFSLNNFYYTKNDAVCEIEAYEKKFCLPKSLSAKDIYELPYSAKNVEGISYPAYSILEFDFKCGDYIRVKQDDKNQTGHKGKWIKVSEIEKTLYVCINSKAKDRNSKCDCGNYKIPVGAIYQYEDKVSCNSKCSDCCKFKPLEEETTLVSSKANFAAIEFVDEKIVLSNDLVPGDIFVSPYKQENASIDNSKYCFSNSKTDSKIVLKQNAIIEFEGRCGEYRLLKGSYTGNGKGLWVYLDKVKKFDFTFEKFKNIVGTIKVPTGKKDNKGNNITEDRTQEIFNLLNEYKQHFGINTITKMSIFIGQIMAESGFSQFRELVNYSSRRIVEVFPKPKYGHLYNEATQTFEKQKDGTYAAKIIYNPINFSTTKCKNKEIDKGDAESTYTYKSENDILKAYTTKRCTVKHKVEDVEFEVKDALPEIPKNIVEFKKVNGNYSLGNLVKEDYEDGWLQVKKEYVRNEKVFDVTYACRNGNGSISSRNGSTYAGVGFIHITGIGNYEAVQREWNNDDLNKNISDEVRANNPGDPAYFKTIKVVGDKKADGTRGEAPEAQYLTDPTKLHFMMKLAMYYWKMRNINEYAVSVNEESVKQVTLMVNGGTKGASTRSKIAENAYNEFTK